MAFLGSVGKFFHKIHREPAFQVIFPGAALSNIAAEKFVSRLADRPSFAETGKPAITAREVGGSRSEYTQYGYQYGPEMPFSGYSFGGGAWDSSMGLGISSETWGPLTSQEGWRVETSPGVDSQGMSWEDLLRASYNPLAVR